MEYSVRCPWGAPLQLTRWDWDGCGTILWWLVLCWRYHCTVSSHDTVSTHSFQISSVFSWFMMKCCFGLTSLIGVITQLTKQWWRDGGRRWQGGGSGGRGKPTAVLRWHDGGSADGGDVPVDTTAAGWWQSAGGTYVVAPTLWRWWGHQRWRHSGWPDADGQPSRLRCQATDDTPAGDRRQHDGGVHVVAPTLWRWWRNRLWRAADDALWHMDNGGEAHLI